MTLTLVSHPLCPYVQRAAIALAEKGAPFTRETISLDAKPDWFRALSPLGKVPLLVLERDGRRDVLFESVPIVEFIEETVPGPALHPADPMARAQHRAWMEFGSSMLADIWGLETAKEEAGYRKAQAALRTKAERLEAALGAGPWFGGAQFSLVDAVFGPVFRYFDVFDSIADTGVFTGLPRIAAWRQALAARPSVRDAAPADYPALLRAFLVRHEAWLLHTA